MCGRASVPGEREQVLVSMSEFYVQVALAEMLEYLDLIIVIECRNCASQRTGQQVRA